jgi:hypothetical protein
MNDEEKNYYLYILGGAEGYFAHSLNRFDEETKKRLTFDDIEAFKRGFLSGITATCAFLKEEAESKKTIN